MQTVHACQTGKHVYVEKPASVTVREGQAMVDAARDEQGRRAGRRAGPHRQGRVANLPRHPQRHRRQGQQSHLLALRESGRRQPRARQRAARRAWIGTCGSARCRGGPTTGAICPANFRWLMESGGGQIRDRGAHQFSTILWCMNADQQTSFTVEATGTVPTKGLWDTAIDMHVVYQFKNPDWTLEWGQPGNKVGKLEFGNVFWGDNGHLVLEWEGGYKAGQSRRRINFQLPPGGKEVYRTDEYEDFNMNHKADWFKSIREGHLRPAVDIEIAHRTATLCNLGNISMLLGRKLVWDGDKQEVVGDEAGQPNAEQAAASSLLPVTDDPKQPPTSSE